MRSTWPSTALSSSWATGELAAASSRASRPSALPDAYCSQQPRLPHSQRWPPGMMIWWPNSPATPKRPRSSRPSITMAPPIPVPSVMQTRRFWPCPAPKRHSAQPAASASLVSSTGRRSSRCRLSRRGSLRHARWGLNSTVPPSRSIQPAAPIPTDQIRWPCAQFLDQLNNDLFDRPGVIARGGPLGLGEDPALRVDHAGRHLGAANVHADGEALPAQPQVLPESLAGRSGGRARPASCAARRPSCGTGRAAVRV